MTNKELDQIITMVRADTRILMLIRKLPKLKQAEELEKLENSMISTIVAIESMKSE